MSAPTTLPPATLADFGARLLAAAGATPATASAIAEVSVWAATRGIDSHGLARIGKYVEMLQSGVANPNPQVKVESSFPGVAVVEADRAAGPLALTTAADHAIATASATGIAAVGVRGTVHTGAIGYYANRIAAAGKVGIGFVAGMPNMGYVGVRGAAVATSPLAIAVPGADGSAVLLDMATATIALGKIAQHRAAGTPLPEGAATTNDGTPTTDPALATMPTPLGGAKGSGMSLAFELITSVLVGAPILAEVHTGGPRKHRQNALLIAIDPAAFGDPSEFVKSVEATVSALKGLPVADGVEEIMVPGERSSAVADTRRREGIPIKPKVWADLAEKAATLEVEIPV